MASTKSGNGSTTRTQHGGGSGSGAGSQSGPSAHKASPLLASLTGGQNAGGDFLSRTAVVWKSALGSCVAWELARWSGSSHPYLAPLTLILCLQASIGQSIRYAWQRSVGTTIGVILIALFAKDLPVAAWTLGLMLLVSTAVMKACRLNDKVIHQVALSILFVWYFEQHSGGYAYDRIKDTLIGAATGIAFMMLLVPPNLSQTAAQGLRKFIDDMAGTLSNLGTSIRRGHLPSGAWDSNQDLNKMRQDLQQALPQLSKSVLDARLNPYGTRAETAALQSKFQTVRTAYVHFLEMVQIVMEWSESTAMSKAEREAWAAAMQGLASWVREWSLHSDTQASVVANHAHAPKVPPARVNPLAVGTPHTDAAPYSVLAHYMAERFVAALCEPNKNR